MIKSLFISSLNAGSAAQYCRCASGRENHMSHENDSDDREFLLGNWNQGDSSAPSDQGNFPATLRALYEWMLPWSPEEPREVLKEKLSSWIKLVIHAIYFLFWTDIPRTWSSLYGSKIATLRVISTYSAPGLGYIVSSHLTSSVGSYSCTKTMYNETNFSTVSWHEQEVRSHSIALML